MEKRAISEPFKQAYKAILKMKGEEKEKAYLELCDRMDMYEVAKDFSAFYPKIYTEEMIERIIKAKNNIEASNILTSLRRKQGEYAW